MQSHFYDQYKVIKPWGEEYVIFRKGKKIMVTLLNLKYGKSTSIHCHPKKKTGFLVLNGKAKVSLGLDMDESLILNSSDKLMIRNGLFHSTTCLSKKGLTLLEFENPADKNDIVRYKDKYGRKFKPYEKQKKCLKKISKEDIIFKLPKNNSINQYEINKKKIIIESVKSINKLKNRPKSEIYAILDGQIIDNFNKSVLGPGDVIKLGTIIKLANSFNLKKHITFLRLMN